MAGLAVDGWLTTGLGCESALGTGDGSAVVEGSGFLGAVTATAVTAGGRADCSIPPGVTGDMGATSGRLETGGAVVFGGDKGAWCVEVGRESAIQFLRKPPKKRLAVELDFST